MSYLRAPHSPLIKENSHDYSLVREQLLPQNCKIEGIQADKGYFVLLQHTFGRNRQMKRILKKMSAGIEAEINNQSQLQRTQRSSVVKRIDVNQSFRQKKGTHNVTVDQCQRERMEERQNWKSLMLRRKNNGKKGQIIKGNTSKSSVSLTSSQQKSPVQHAKCKINPTNSFRYHRADIHDVQVEENIRIKISSIRLSSLPHESYQVKLKNSLSTEKGCLSLKQTEAKSINRKTVVTFPESNGVPAPAQRSLSPWETEGRVAG